MRNREARLSSSGGPDARSEAGCAMRSALRFCLGVPARRGTILGPSPEGLAMRLREATPEDAEAIVAVPVAAWRAAYVGIVPEPALAAMSVGEKTERRRHSLMLSAGDATSAFEGESYAISLLRRAPTGWPWPPAHDSHVDLPRGIGLHDGHSLGRARQFARTALH